VGGGARHASKEGLGRGVKNEKHGRGGDSRRAKSASREQKIHATPAELAEMDLFRVSLRKRGFIRALQPTEFEK
jgi:hypothetical protein